MAYDFTQQYAEGEQGEAFLDAFFTARGHAIQIATREEQRQGIDRVITSPRGEVLRVEYKTDLLAGQTGNAFIETVSVDSSKRMGWSLTAKADYLIYYLPARTIYVLPFRSIHWMLPGWIREYPVRQARNRTYSTHGLLVPLEEIAKIAVQTFDVSAVDIEE